VIRPAAIALTLSLIAIAARADSPAWPPRFSRHVEAVFSRLGCNAGICHGAVKGKNGFRLSLFSASPELDYDQLVGASRGRRLTLSAPDHSLLLLKPTTQVPHQGGHVADVGSHEYQILHDWIAAGARLDAVAESRIDRLQITPAAYTAKPTESYRLRVVATFADDSSEDVTALCSYDSLDKEVATVDRDGLVSVRGVGDTALIVRYRAEPVLTMLMVPSPSPESFPNVEPLNFVDREIVDKLRRLNIPPSTLTDDVTFLRRASLDVTGELPLPAEILAFLADPDPQKRAKKIDELLLRPGHAAIWTLKFCDILRASDFGVYADGIKPEDDAPRFQQWIRARLEENIPYDQFVERILTATSREGRSVEAWTAEVMGLHEGANKDRQDVALYSQRHTLDLYWQRKAAAGVSGTLQIAHAFLGLRLECAQCHRHPHDVWQQDDLLSFANFFMHVRQPGFQGDNEKKFPDLAVIEKKYVEEGKQLLEEAKKLKESEGKRLEDEARQAKSEADKLKSELDKLEKQRAQWAAESQQKRNQAVGLKESNSAEADGLTAQAAELDQKAQTAAAEIEQQRTRLDALALKESANTLFKQRTAEMERRGHFLPEAGKRILHAEICHLPGGDAWASVTSPLGTQTSKQMRLLGETAAIEIPADQDPRAELMVWLRRKDNPFFAKAIVNRVWAHYFGRGIVDPPDNLSPLNPASHPQLLAELCRQFIEHGYDLKWLHRTILASRTYQQSSLAGAANRVDRTNYAYFYYRRLPAEVLLDALNQATGTSENMDMAFWRWPAQMKTVEIPSTPRNAFVTFMLENFGRPPRNSAVQCDCERDSNASVLQVLSLANHPRVRQKIADDKGQVARIVKEVADDDARIDEVFLSTVSRFPSPAEKQACLKYVSQSDSPATGLQGVAWSLLNTREFLLQH
jgi:hypothetical protein